MTDVPGVMKNKDDPSTLFRELDIQDCRGMIKDGIIVGGMIPKVRPRQRKRECCLEHGAENTYESHFAWLPWMFNLL